MDKTYSVIGDLGGLVVDTVIHQELFSVGIFDAVVNRDGDRVSVSSDMTSEASLMDNAMTNACKRLVIEVNDSDEVAGQEVRIVRYKSMTAARSLTLPFGVPVGCPFDVQAATSDVTATKALTVSPAAGETINGSADPVVISEGWRAALFSKVSKFDWLLVLP